MPIQATLIPSDPTLPPTVITINELADLHLTVELKRNGTPASYDAYYLPRGHQIAVIEVLYTGTSTEDFRLRGTTDDKSKPEITKIDHIVSTGMTTRVAWAYPQEDTIDWVFEDPSTFDTEVSWEFNHSGNTPPVRVKVVLKRQS